METEYEGKKFKRVRRGSRFSCSSCFFGLSIGGCENFKSHCFSNGHPCIEYHIWILIDSPRELLTLKP